MYCFMENRDNYNFQKKSKIKFVTKVTYSYAKQVITRELNILRLL